MSTPLNTNRQTPTASVRREQVQGQDPLFDAYKVNNIAASSPLSSDPTNFYTSPLPPPPPANSQNVTPVPQFPQRPQSVADSVEQQADMFLKNCILPLERQRGMLLKFTDVPSSVVGLRQLRNTCSWQDLFKLSLQLLSEPSVNNLTGNERNEILFIRFEALYRTKLFDDLLSELNREIISLELAADDNIVSFDRLCSHRLLLQEVRLMSGQGTVALEGLLSLSHNLSALSSSIDSDQVYTRQKAWRALYWHWTTQLQVINAQLRLRHWRRALSLLRRLQAEVVVDRVAIHEEEKSDLCFARIALSNRLVRLLLQMGDKQSAKNEFESATLVLSLNPALTADFYLQQTLLLSQGLLYFADEHYDQAAEAFTHLLNSERARDTSPTALIYPTLLTDCSHGRAFRLTLVEASDESLLSAALNNLALSLLHQKQNHAAIAKLESLLAENPPRFMNDAVVFNLCTLYDLSYSPDASQQRKKILQKVALRFGLIDPVLHWRSFRAN